ncbi:hypothetical protein BT69DRAFT_1280541 [Atractiella rhizophila]|nr:hypothetical protein BT69DRAFT_1280541 [Atractiella rhizophila]
MRERESMIWSNVAWVAVVAFPPPPPPIPPTPGPPGVTRGTGKGMMVLSLPLTRPVPPPLRSNLPRFSLDSGRTLLPPTPSDIDCSALPPGPVDPERTDPGGLNIPPLPPRPGRTGGRRGVGSGSSESDMELPSEPDSSAILSLSLPPLPGTMRALVGWEEREE